MGCERKWVRCSEPEEQGEEEESLSLCDLPVDLLAGEEEEEKPLLSANDGEQEAPGLNSTEDFDFGAQLLGGSTGSRRTCSEMCAADDIFFQGQILPFRHSVSGYPFKCTGQKQDSLSTTRSNSRSESMDRSSSNGGFISFSSRSSSTNSHYSSSSSSASSNSNSNSNSTAAGRPRIINRFHTFPSPKPQIIKTPNAPPLGSAAGAGINRSKKSSIWETLRLGLVRAPEIEFQDLKSRSSVSRNSSTGSSKAEKEKQGKNPPPLPSPTAKTKRSYSTGRLLGGCDCTVGAVQPVALLNHENNYNNIVVVKSSKKKHHRNDRRRDKQSAGVGEGETKSKTTTMATEGKEKEKEKQQRGGKQEASRHRTVEWIKKLSSSSHGVVGEGS